MTENLCFKYGVNGAKEDFSKALKSVDPVLTNEKVKLSCVENIYLVYLVVFIT